jgi:uncharacterized Fe-S cluster-containing MiaB family protein
MSNGVALDKISDENQSAKADAGKLQISLCPTQIVRDVTEVRMFGNAKYKSSDNWKTVEMRRYVDALLRHALEFVDNPESVDSESGIPHYTHMACNMAFICEMMAGRVPQKCRTYEEITEREG